MKILVTGAGGNLGRGLAPALVAEGHVPKLFDARVDKLVFSSTMAVYAESMAASEGAHECRFRAVARSLLRRLCSLSRSGRESKRVGAVAARGPVSAGQGGVELEEVGPWR